MLRTNKKGGFIFEPIVALGLVVVLVYAFIVVTNKQAMFNERIGEKQLKLIDAYYQGEKHLIYTDYAAKLSAMQALYDLALYGGEIEEKCGNYFGYTLWSDQNKPIGACFPTYKDNFAAMFEEHLNSHFTTHEETSVGYTFDIKNSLDVIGMPDSGIDFKIGNVNIREVAISDFIVAPTLNQQPQDKKPILTPSPQTPLSSSCPLVSAPRPSGVKVDRIVLHHTGDDAASKTCRALQQFGLSVHYIIDRDGTIVYAVDEGKMAFHAKGQNSKSIGIEIVNTGRASMQYTPAQYAAIKQLINDIAKRWPDVKVDNEHVVAHYQVSDIGKWDPSPNFDWAQIGLGSHQTLASLGKKAPTEYGYA